jgi:hypothetical protein
MAGRDTDRSDAADPPFHHRAARAPQREDMAPPADAPREDREAAPRALGDWASL